MNTNTKYKNNLFLSHKTICLKNKNALKTILERRFFLDFMHFFCSTQFDTKILQNVVKYIKESDIYERTISKISANDKRIIEDTN